MATSADAESALAALLASALTTLPATVKTIRGWPASKALDTEMVAGNVVVSVYRLDVSRNTTRYIGQPTTAAVPAPTLTASVSGAIATFNGAAATGQVAGLIANGVAYAIRTQTGDTATSVAARIGALMPDPVSISGATVMAAGLSDARTAADAMSAREVGRQENTLQADIWCPTPTLRDQAEALALPAVADATFLTMPDGSRARVRIGAVMASDQASPLTIYRLMLRVTAEVALSVNETAAIMLWPGFTIGAGPLQMGDAGPAQTIISSGTMTTGNTGLTNTVTYTETQPALVWTITHGLNRYPNVTVVDTAGQQVEPDIQYLSLNVVQLTFSAATAGIAYLS